MTDYLTTIVEDCKTEWDSTKVVLSYEVKYPRIGTMKEEATYELPFAFNLKKGDRLFFSSDCILGGENPSILHRSYRYVEIAREGKFVVRFNGEDLENLTNNNLLQGLTL